MKTDYFTIFLFLLLNFSASSQSNVIKFEDGVYMTLEEFKTNNPSIKAASIVHFEIFEESHEYIKHFKLKVIEEGKTKLKIKTKDIWGICINGEPYIQHSITGNLFRLHIIGALSMFSDIHITSANVKTGDNNGVSSYKTANQLQKGVPKILVWSTGDVFEFTSESISILIATDIELSEMFEGELFKEDKLFKYLKLFNERNPIYLDAVKTNQNLNSD